MQPSDTQLTGVPQQIIIDPNTGLPQNVIIIQQPSSPKIIGIFIIIFGAITMSGDYHHLETRVLIIFEPRFSAVNIIDVADISQVAIIFKHSLSGCTSIKYLC